MTHQQRLPKFTHSYMDSCAFNPGGSEEECIRRLARLYDDGEINKEIGHPNTPGDIKKRAATLIFTTELSLNQEQVTIRETLRAMIRGNGKPGQHEKDADHIFDLQMHGGGYFITTDARLLSLSGILFKKYSVTTITPCEYEELL